MGDEKTNDRAQIFRTVKILCMIFVTTHYIFVQTQRTLICTVDFDDCYVLL